jgi:hypothetical protein
MQTGADASRDGDSAQPTQVLLLDRNLDLGTPVAQTSVAILLMSERLTPREEQAKENQQASEQSFHALPLHEWCKTGKNKNPFHTPALPGG